MTDMSNGRSTWWSVTAFGADEIAQLHEQGNYPRIVKKVYGGTEMCPTTQREHFQGAIQLHSVQRLAALKRWLPTAHLEPAKNSEALKRYAMKEDTAIEEKQERFNPDRFLKYHDILKLLYLEYKRTHKTEFYDLVNPIIARDIKLAVSFNNSIKTTWSNCWMGIVIYFETHPDYYGPDPEDPLSITGDPDPLECEAEWIADLTSEEGVLQKNNLFI